MSPQNTDSANTILLVVGGGIAAYKALGLVRELQRSGHTVDTVLTEAAQHFVGPLSFSALTNRIAHTNLWTDSHPGELHIELTRRAKLVVVAPATADLLAKAACGLANDLASTCLLAARCPILVAPAMHPAMWNNPATQHQLGLLRSRGVHFVGPEDGPLASGESGIGRMTEPELISKRVSELFAPELQGLRVLVTAGPTYEALDPVRFLGNRSSGKMGLALATRAAERGADVTLVHGPIQLAPPPGVLCVGVRSAREMHAAVFARYDAQDVIIKAAAVADYRPAEIASEKLKKRDEGLVLHLVKNPDILAELGARRGEAKHPVLVGFAVETQALEHYALDKLRRKRCDMIVANLATHGFEGNDNTATFVMESGIEAQGTLSKHELADRILDRVVALRATRSLGSLSS